MNEINPTNIAPIAPPATMSASESLGNLGPDAFLKLLVAQLKYQNPMEPSDGTQLLQQTAQFTQVETLQSLADSQEQLMNVTQFSLAVGLSGKRVSAYDASGNPVAGQVESIRFATTGPELQIDQTWVPLSNVLEVAPED
ncbi:MAG: flagellar hook capping protein [Acidimicrobiia bacterium]|nr:flagellar hook capping protein [Acidimicrobiia bacterium]